MDKEAAKLRRELSRLETGRGKRYPTELRQRVVAWAQRRHEQGASWETIKAELGQKFDTVRRWCLLARSSRALVPVRVVSTSPVSRTVSVVSPAGFRVEGLAINEAAALLRELG
jgi:hypothetical protein